MMPIRTIKWVKGSHIFENYEYSKRFNAIILQVLWALQEGGILDIILYIASSDDERQYFFHILEVISFLFSFCNV